MMKLIILESYGSFAFVCVYINILYPHQRQRRFSYMLHFSPQLQELLEYMPGPDFPTGGIIMGNQGYAKFYFTFTSSN